MNLNADILRTIGSITEFSVIQIEAHGETNEYVIKEVSDDSLDLVMLNAENAFWDGGFVSIEEIKNRLAADYSIGIITEIAVSKN